MEKVWLICIAMLLELLKRQEKKNWSKLYVYGEDA